MYLVMEVRDLVLSAEEGPMVLFGFYCTFEDIRHEDGFTNLASGDSHRGVASKLSSSSRLINPHCSGSGSGLGASL